jgi:hypothetical protein
LDIDYFQRLVDFLDAPLVSRVLGLSIMHANGDILQSRLLTLRVLQDVGLNFCASTATFMASSHALSVCPQSLNDPKFSISAVCSPSLFTSNNVLGITD